MHEPVTTTQIAIHGGIALFGAITHALQAHRKGESKSLLDFVVLTAMSSFSGVMFAIIGLQVFEHQAYLSMAMAGTGGFLGVEGMAVLVPLIIDKLRILIKK